MAENYRICAFYLIVKEFAEILHIHLTLLGVYNTRISAENCACGSGVLYRTYNVGKLSYARGLDHNSVGSKVCYYLVKCFSEITY